MTTRAAWCTESLICLCRLRHTRSAHTSPFGTTFFTGDRANSLLPLLQLRLVTAIPAYSVCAAAFLGIGAKHLLTSNAPGLAALDAATTFALTLPLPLYMHTFTEVTPSIGRHVTRRLGLFVRLLF